MDHHLATWTPRLFANVLFEAGFSVMECRVITTAWHPRLFPLMNLGLTRMVCWATAIALRRRQLLAVAASYRSSRRANLVCLRTATSPSAPLALLAKNACSLDGGLVSIFMLRIGFLTGSLGDNGGACKPLYGNLQKHSALARKFSSMARPEKERIPHSGASPQSAPKPSDTFRACAAG